MILLIAMDTYYNFRFFSMRDEEGKNRVCGRQLVCMFMLHFLANILIWLNTESVTMLAFYGAQVVFFLLYIYLTRLFYRNSSRLLVNNMCTLLATGFIILTRLNPDRAMRQFVIVAAAAVITWIIPFIIDRVWQLVTFPWVYGILGLVLLGVVCVIGNTSYGAQLSLSFGGFTVQPSEFVKEDLEEVKGRKYLFVAGGVGTAPVYPQVKWMHEHGIDVDVIVGAKNKELLILEDMMKEVAGNLYITTDDGSYVRKGMVTDVIKDLVETQGNHYDVCVAIGPMIMMKFVCKLTKELNIPTIVSMNPIMVDGTGMCGACRLTVGDEVKFACVDGPEFDGHLVNFDEAMKRQQMYRTEEGRAMLKAQEGDTHHGGCGNCN